ncbi:MAG: DNA-binding protein, partial [Clostridiales bacterium]|nr:DNA-binding protein [Clostridiales bacterium]
VSEKFIDDVEWGKRVLSDDILKRISKALGQEISDILLMEAEAKDIPMKEVRQPAVKVKQEVSEVWSDAFDSILKTIPVYDLSLEKILETRQLPVVSGKVDGYGKDKVFFLEIQDNDMIGFRILKGDIAFACTTHEIENNTICLVEFNGNRVIRQIKKLDQDKILLVNDSGRLTTETISVKQIKVLAKLIKLEIKL